MGILKIENLCKAFGDNVILQNVNADIGKGEVISIIGPSGTGKSTFLRAINFLDPPTSGTVYFEGEPIDKKNVNTVRKKMGMVFQNFGLFTHLNVTENLCTGPMKLLNKSREAAEATAAELLKTVGMTERAYHLPCQLSGGQKQRVAIARCLAMEPEVILFDEPTSALDPTMVGEVIAVIRQLAKTGLTIMIVTHEMSFAHDISDRVFYMDEKGIYEQGTPQEIFDNPQKPKTQAFIYKIRSFTYEIHSKDFDYVEMLAGIDNFCFSHAVETDTAKKLRLLAEELVINIVVPKFSECRLTLSFSEKLARYEIEVIYPGKNNNILNTTEDELAAAIVQNTAGHVTHGFENGMDVLKLVL